MEESQFLHLLDKYLQGQCTPDEADLLNRFYDSFQEDALEDESDAFDMWLREEKIHRNVKRLIAYEERRHYGRQSLKKAKSRTLLKAAASVLLILSLGLGSYVAYTNIPTPEVAWLERSTKKGQKATITLTDGSKVYLNVDSKISFPEHFDSDKREVILEGEAFFDVAKNAKRPFIIKSGALTTTVLGTSFNIKAFAGEPMHVTVATGKVKVSSDEPGGTSSEVFLNPYQQAFYDGHLSKKDVDIQQFIAWRQKILHFDEVSLGEVAAVLERWFNVSITIENEEIRHCEISGQYINENLVNVLESLEHILGIEYRAEGEREIMIKGEKCNAQNQYSDDTL
ncbi:MAG: FecR domain-containing protein [Cyclobacteriaceae bacterium]